MREHRWLPLSIVSGVPKARGVICAHCLLTREKAGASCDNLVGALIAADRAEEEAHRGS